MPQVSIVSVTSSLFMMSSHKFSCDVSLNCTKNYKYTASFGMLEISEKRDVPFKGNLHVKEMILIDCGEFDEYVKEYDNIKLDLDCGVWFTVVKEIGIWGWYK